MHVCHLVMTHVACPLAADTMIFLPSLSDDRHLLVLRGAAGRRGAQAAGLLGASGQAAAGDLPCVTGGAAVRGSLHPHLLYGVHLTQPGCK